MSQLTESMSSALSIDTDAFQNAFQFNMDESELSDLIMSLMTSSSTSYDSNLAALNYADLAAPYEIDIYAKTFDAKGEITDILDAYNARMVASGQEDREVTYTDLVGTLMRSVTTIIDMISYMLIAFVSISLIVSSIMIGIITYISVLERRKEIGILRAVGASKKDVSRIFNAETIIEGLTSGLMGVIITALACIPASAIVYAHFDVPNIAQLPLQAAIVLVLISVGLSFIAGLIPARSASKKDPVEALRSE
jgi:ABC-type antimicrobial peptide transport system permease subunit